MSDKQKKISVEDNAFKKMVDWIFYTHNPMITSEGDKVNLDTVNLIKRKDEICERMKKEFNEKSIDFYDTLMIYNKLSPIGYIFRGIHENMKEPTLGDIFEIETSKTFRENLKKEVLLERWTYNLIMTRLCVSEMNMKNEVYVNTREHVNRMLDMNLKFSTKVRIGKERHDKYSTIDRRLVKPVIDYDIYDFLFELVEDENKFYENILSKRGYSENGKKSILRDITLQFQDYISIIKKTNIKLREKVKGEK